MAITYVNDLRLSEMGTGDNSGTWGTVTNTNLELIGDAMGYGTRAIANDSTDNITIADGTADADRAMYLKLTGGGQACTVTLLPNTVSKVWMMENGTNSALTFTQGSGANVVIPAGDTKIIASDGGGSDAIVYDVFASLSVGVLSTATADNNPQITLVSTATNASQGPVLDLYRNSSSPADNDLGGAIKFNAENDAGEKTQYQIIQAYMPDVSNGSEDGAFQHYVMKDGTSIQRLEHSPTETVFNQDSADVDFRVESNGNANMLFVDGGSDHVNIGTSTDLGGVFNVSGATASKFFSTDRHVMSLVSTEAGASDGPRLVIQRDSSSPADGDQLGILEFYGENDADEATEYARINASIVDASDGTEDGALGINTRIAGANVNRIYLPPTEAVFNENSADIDFRVESNGNANQFFVDGGNDSVHIGAGSNQAVYLSQGTGFQIQGLGSTGSAQSVTRHSNDSGGPYLIFGKTRGTATGATTAVANGDVTGHIISVGADGTDLLNPATEIRFSIDGADGAPGSNDMPGMIRFFTNSGNTAVTQAMQINHAQRVSIGTTGVVRRLDVRTGNVTVAGFFYQDLSDVSLMQLGHSRATASNTATMIQFQNGAGSEVGTIKSTASATAYNTSSDYRLKENVEYTWDATTRLKKLKPARFNWIADDTNTLVDGFMAHEAAEVVPEAVFNEKDQTKTITNTVLNSFGNVIQEDVTEEYWIEGKSDQTDSEGNVTEAMYPSDSTWTASKEIPVYQQIDQSKLVPLLVKTIQELEARITALES